MCHILCSKCRETMSSGCICSLVTRFNGGYVSIWVVLYHPDDEGFSGWAMVVRYLDLREQYPDGMTSRQVVPKNGWYRKATSTRKWLVEKLGWH
jgi:hypothetical protein